MDFSKIEKLAEIMKTHGLAEVEWEEGESRLRLAFPTGSAMGHVAMMPQMAQGHMVMGQGFGGQASPSPMVTTKLEAKTPEASAVANQKVIKSPFVGTFYEASAPGADPFVRIGKRVKKGDTLCIIEAMKLMNGIESEFDGVIAKVLVQNGDPVEFDQPLFLLEP